MALQNVPWAIGNGAHNQVEGARLSLYAATKGATGVMRPSDLQVTALPVPGGAVRVHTGAGVAASRYPGASAQSYAVRETSSTDVGIDATGSSGARTRYLVVRVHDHQYSGEPTPSNVQDGPYNEYEWLSSDPWASPPAFPVVPLAKLVQPANTATITNEMITDVRRVANPRSDSQLRTYALLSEDTESLATIGSDNSSGETWPRQADTVQEPILIPDWATRARIVQTWAGVRTPSARTSGRVWLQVGGDGNPKHVKTQTVKYTTGPTESRDTLIVADMVWIPPELRGTHQKFIPRGNREPGSTSVLVLDGASAIVTQVEFLERI